MNKNINFTEILLKFYVIFYKKAWKIIKFRKLRGGGHVHRVVTKKNSVAISLLIRPWIIVWWRSFLNISPIIGGDRFLKFKKICLNFNFKILSPPRILSNSLYQINILAFSIILLSIIYNLLYRKMRNYGKII